MPIRDLQPWETTLETTGKKRLAEFLFALIAVQGHFTCSLCIGGLQYVPHASIEFMVQIPVDREKTFEELSGCKLKKISRLQVGMKIVGGFDYQGDFAKLSQHRY